MTRATTTPATAPATRTRTATFAPGPISAESVTEGHPDKVSDFIADSILDAYLQRDPHARVALEVLCKGRQVVLAGEITAAADVDLAGVARAAIRRIGYVDPESDFSAERVDVLELVSAQAPEIARGVGAHGEASGAGDQGVMVGYATNETPELMPLPTHLAHAITATLAGDRHAGAVSWLRPDGKAQVTVRYGAAGPEAIEAVVVAAQHAPGVGRATWEPYIRDELLPRALRDWYRDDLRVLINPAGTFEDGGPAVDCGVTGRKNAVDTYGPSARHGGGALSGKDPSKTDRSASYFCRLVARRLVSEGFADRVEVHVAYAIGQAQPVAIHVDTFGGGDAMAAAEFARREFDFRPAAIVRRLDLLRPIYATTTNYGHFGRPGFSWEG